MLELMSPTIGSLVAALAKAQSQFRPAVKDAANPFFKSKYCDLAGAIDAIRDALVANGLAVIQATDITEGGQTILRTILGHTSGEWIAASYPINPVKADPQGYGSALTYARRYSLMAIVGLAAEDDDGNHASGVQQRPAWTDAQKQEAKRLRTAAVEAGHKEAVEDIWKAIDTLTPTEVLSALEALPKTKETKK